MVDDASAPPLEVVAIFVWLRLDCGTRDRPGNERMNVCMNLIDLAVWLFFFDDVSFGCLCLNSQVLSIFFFSK